MTNHFALLAFVNHTASLKSLLWELTEVANCEISLNTNCILKLIMSEKDIKALKSAITIDAFFCLHYISMIDGPTRRTAFQSLLHSLKSKRLLMI